jgi:hypothetical protein
METIEKHPENKDSIKRPTKFWHGLIPKRNEFAVGIIIAVVSTLITLISLRYSILGYKQFFIIINEIPVGIGPFYMDTKDKLENQYIAMFKDMNDFLRQEKSKYRLFPVVSRNVSYTHIYKDLEDGGQLKIASISPFNYLLFINGKTKYNSSNFTLLGFKYIDSRTTYRSRMIWHRKLKVNYKDIIYRIKKNQNSKEDSCLLILTREERSASCHVVPEIFLLEHGVNLKRLQHKSMDRPKMIAKILKDSLNIGFISNEDYEEQLTEDQKKNLDYYEINMPLPFDAFLANTNWWNSLGRDRLEIRRGLESSRYGINASEKSNLLLYKWDIFSLYVGSGVFYIDSTDKFKIDTTIIIPDRPIDILYLHDTLDSHKVVKVQLIKFTVGNINAYYSTLDTIVLGKTTIIKNRTGYKFTDKKKLDSILSKYGPADGIHVLPLHFKKYEEKVEHKNKYWWPGIWP